ncbi:Ethylene-responsive transcription factor [Thalictrum thalictroides]|uniref:Ethylene-responsive transcription factor n=1 Tax=Thalictrum thalictroides TaxID=46969 RepID=A0A7J6UR14_THATH|nr:Ethylene-responsive transcription factor [Thalictrum thalictroides]
MVKPESSNRGGQINDKGSNGMGTGTVRYKGVRRRKWGKWVAEIRLPNCRDRIWLGSYETAEKAARAYDAAVYCVRGPTAEFNFPTAAPPELPASPSKLTHQQIQTVASEYASQEVALPMENEYGRQSVPESSPATTTPNSIVFDMPTTSNADEIVNWDSIDSTLLSGLNDIFGPNFDGFLGDF